MSFATFLVAFTLCECRWAVVSEQRDPGDACLSEDGMCFADMKAEELGGKLLQVDSSLSRQLNKPPDFYRLRPHSSGAKSQPAEHAEQKKGEKESQSRGAPSPRLSAEASASHDHHKSATSRSSSDSQRKAKKTHQSSRASTAKSKKSQPKGKSSDIRLGQEQVKSSSPTNRTSSASRAGDDTKRSKQPHVAKTTASRSPTKTNSSKSSATNSSKTALAKIQRSHGTDKGAKNSTSHNRSIPRHLSSLMKANSSKANESRESRGVHSTGRKVAVRRSPMGKPEHSGHSGVHAEGHRLTAVESHGRSKHQAAADAAAALKMKRRRIKAEQEYEHENKGTLMNPAIGGVLFLMSAPAGVLLVLFSSLVMWVKSHEIGDEAEER